MARPDIYTPELADKICGYLSIGRSLNSICKDEDMPCMSSVMNWLAKADMGDERYAGLMEKYLRAREAQADVIFDECLDIADDSGADAVIDKQTGGIKIEGEVIQRAKLRIDTRMRMAGKLKPKKYGDRQSIDLNGNIELSDLTEDELAANIKKLAAEAGISIAIAGSGSEEGGE